MQLLEHQVALTCPALKRSTAEKPWKAQLCQASASSTEHSKKQGCDCLLQANDLRQFDGLNQMDGAVFPQVVILARVKRVQADPLPTA